MGDPAIDLPYHQEELEFTPDFDPDTTEFEKPATLHALHKLEMPLEKAKERYAEDIKTTHEQARKKLQTWDPMYGVISIIGLSFKESNSFKDAIETAETEIRSAKAGSENFDNMLQNVAAAMNYINSSNDERLQRVSQLLDYTFDMFKDPGFNLSQDEFISISRLTNLSIYYMFNNLVANQPHGDIE